MYASIICRYTSRELEESHPTRSLNRKRQKKMT